MTIESEINRIKQNIASCYTTLTAKGATIPAVENVANLAACIRTIPAGVADSFVTQSGDTIVTSAGTPLALDGISSLTTAPSITDGLLTFADDGNDTVKFSMLDLKEYVNPTPAAQGRFVAIAYNTDNFAYSSDGETWTTGTLPSSQYWGSLVYGDGKFIAKEWDSNVASYSTDGVNWTSSTIPSYANSFAYGNGVFVGIAWFSDTYVYSTDGINWVESILPTTYSWKFVSYCNDKFIAVSYNNDRYIPFITSTDGINWVNTNINVVDNYYDPRSIAYGNNTYVIVGVGDDRYTGLYSSDGINWTRSSMPMDGNNACGWNSVTYGNNKFVAVGEREFEGDHYATNVGAYSEDGINWYTSTLPSSQSWVNVLYANNVFVAIASGTNVCAYSSDGITWTAGTLPSSQSWISIAYGEI